MTEIPLDQRDGFIWQDGQLVAWKEAKTHVLTHGLHYASSVFEGIRAYNGKAFKLTEHNERLVKSADILDMKIPYTVAELDAACNEVIKANNLTDCYLRPVVFRGPEQLGLGAPNAKIHVAIAAWVWPKYFSPELLERGISLLQTDWRRPSPDSAPWESKAAGLYMICTLAKHDAIRKGYTDALMLDYRGLVAEATAANLFMVKDAKIKTPIADCFLNGITRQTVIQLAKDVGISVEETRIELPELMSADEIFLTGTAAEITPVGKINNTDFTVGPVTKQMLKLYEDLVNR
ncbi:MAG TPA: branched-chain amino acid aminotransferase [Alphaproteobacteria bacterium]